MYINQLMKEQDMTYEELCERTGIAGSTIRDILDGTSYIPNCKASTLYDIAYALNTTVEDILVNCWDDEAEDDEDEVEDEFVLEPDRPEAFYPAQGDFLLAMHKINNDISFINSLLETKAIKHMAEMGSSTMTLYAIAMIDYLCRIHKLPIPKELAFYRKYRKSFPAMLARVVWQTLLMKPNLTGQMNMRNCPRH